LPCDDTTDTTAAAPAASSSGSSVTDAGQSMLSPVEVVPRTEILSLIRIYVGGVEACSALQ
jgi:hypothetical protein